MIMSSKISNSMPMRNLTSDDSRTGFQARPARYGLPCAHCHAYYEADLTVCPICNCRERVPARVEVSNIVTAF